MDLPGSSGFNPPRVSATAPSLLLLIPYFAYVFDFLDPEKVIARIGAQTLEGAAPHRRATAGAGGGAEDTSMLEARQTLAVSGLEQLAGVAMNALAQKEKTIATDATAALRRVLCDYLPEKQALPAAWFELSRDGNEPKWTRHVFDNDSGVGTQFEVHDMNADGLLDVIVANKRGVFYFEQTRD